MDLSKMPADDLFFACMREGGEQLWIEFIRRFQPLIASVAVRVAAQWGAKSPAMIDDLVQETYLKLFADRELLLQKITLDHDNAIFGYIKVFAANLIHDHFKALNSKRRGGNIKEGVVEEVASNPNPEVLGARTNDFEMPVVIHEVDRYLRALCGETAPNKRDRRIFWLYFRLGFSAREIALLPGIDLSTKGVESTLLRLTRALRRQLDSCPRSTDAAAEGISRTESF